MSVSAHQQALAQIITDNPGLYLRELHALLQRIPLGTLDYRLRQLQHDNIISIEYFGRKKHFFNANVLVPARPILIMLRNPVMRAITERIIEHPGISNAMLAKCIGLSPATVSWYLVRMKRLGVVAAERRTYRVLQKESIERVLLEHKASFSHDVVRKFLQSWEM